ncbi:MAG: site-2 protease family protein [Ignavibacteriales bacterium]
MPEIAINEKLISFLLFLPVFFISLAFHEYSHAFVAWKYGDNTAKNQGRLTLNPIKHIDLIGSVLMPLVSFASGFFIIGWAKPVPVNRKNFKNMLRDDAVVSFAGPVANFILAVVLFAGFAALDSNASGMGMTQQRIISLLQMGSYFNIFLFAFNLLPIPPLDGSHILFDLFPNRITSQIVNSGLYGFVILMLFIYSPLWGYFIKFVNFVYEIFLYVSGKY